MFIIIYIATWLWYVEIVRVFISVLFKHERKYCIEQYVSGELIWTVFINMLTIDTYNRTALKFFIGGCQEKYIMEKYNLQVVWRM